MKSLRLMIPFFAATTTIIMSITSRVRAKVTQKYKKYMF